MNHYLKQILEVVVSYAPNVFGAFLTLVIGFWLVSLANRILQKSLDRQARLDETVKPFILSAVNIGLKILLLITVAGMFGVETTSFIAIFSALTFAVGMALQGNLSHFASGVLILVLKPFKVGDKIVAGGYKGTIKEIQIFNTLMVAEDNRLIIVPNGNITSGPIENHTANGQLRLEATVKIDEDYSIDLVRTILCEVIDQCPYYLSSNDRQIVVSGLEEDSMIFTVRFWVPSEEIEDATFFIYEHIKKALLAEGIVSPNDEIDVNMLAQNP